MFRQKRPRSDSIHTFVDILFQFEKEHPDDIFPPAIEPQLVVDCLRDVFLGTDWYVTLPMCTKQVNTVILDKILREYSEEFRKIVKEKKKTKD